MLSRASGVLPVLTSMVTPMAREWGWVGEMGAAGLCREGEEQMLCSPSLPWGAGPARAVPRLAPPPQPEMSPWGLCHRGFATQQTVLGGGTERSQGKVGEP